MKLLESEVIESDFKKKQQEISDRVRALTKEENKAVDDLNKVKTESEIEKKRIQEETKTFVAEQKTRAESAKREANAIESFRRDVLKVLLKPIDEIENEAKQKLEVAIHKEATLEKEKQHLETEKEELRNRESRLNEYEKGVVRLAKGFEKREKDIMEREKQAKVFIARERRKVEVELNKARKLL